MSFTQEEKAKFGAFLHFVDEYVVNELSPSCAINFIELMLDYDLDDQLFTHQLRILLSVSEKLEAASKDISEIRTELCGEGRNAHDARVMTSKHFHHKLKKLRAYVQSEQKESEVLGTVQDLRKYDIEESKRALEQLNIELQALYEQEVEERKERQQIKKELQEGTRIRRQAEHDELMEELRERREYIENEIKELQARLQAEHDASVEERKERKLKKKLEFEQARINQEKKRDQQADERKRQQELEQQKMKSRQNIVKAEQERQFRERMERKQRGDFI